MSSLANIKVIARFRPMNELEKTSGNEQLVASQISLQYNSSREKNIFRFSFDHVFPPSLTKEDIYSFRC